MAITPSGYLTVAEMVDRIGSARFGWKVGTATEMLEQIKTNPLGAAVAARRPGPERERQEVLREIIVEMLKQLEAGQLVGARVRQDGSIAKCRQDEWRTDDAESRLIAALTEGRLFIKSPVEPARGIVSTGKGEATAIAALTPMLERNPEMPLSSVIDFCLTIPGVSRRGAKDRVWPKARKAAGLPEKGSAGRKRK